MLTKQFIQVSTVIALMVISITGFAQTKVVVIPLFGDDVPIVPTSKTIFVTSGTYEGNLGGISGADDKCQAEANSASVPGIFKAWLSTDITESIGNRVSFIQHDLPYNNLNGDNVAKNFDQFLTGNLDNQIDRIDAPDGDTSLVWTGTEDDGTPHSSNCENFTSDNAFTEGRLGFAHGGLNFFVSWSSAGFIGCGERLHLYCFEQ